jgi:homoserine O-succinyltransferase/O-acetyltransferase
VRVGFVNNMPDGAFDETERQYLRLLCPGTAPSGLQVSRYVMPGIERGADTRRRILRRYRPIDALYADSPDALIVTGTEPRRADLRDEAYWAQLASLLRWAEGCVPVTLLSCLASHGALLALDGIERRPLPAKLSGVFSQRPRPTHPLVEGLASVSFPHSRANDVPTELLGECGYVVLVDAPGIGWTVAARERDGRLLVLLQGHPEYSPTALLREYRRDVRRFVEGTALLYPPIPEGYLDTEGVALLEGFRCAGGPSGRPDMADFPFHAAAAHIAVSWQLDSERLLQNWLAEAHRRAMPAGGATIDMSSPRRKRA